MALTLELFRFFVKCSMTERVEANGLRKWQQEIEECITRMPSRGLIATKPVLDEIFDAIHSKLVGYEQSKEDPFLLATVELMLSSSIPVVSLLIREREEQ